jgi:hypothetical protein
VVAGDQQLLQCHGQAISTALGAVLDLQRGLIGLASTGATTTTVNLNWRVDLLDDVTESARELAVLITALVVAELDEPGLS